MKKIIIALFVLTSLANKAQQDPQYSLYQFNQMVINPAYAGSRDAIAIVADVRKQWVGFSGAPTTAALSVHSPIMNNKLGVGLNVVNDKIGAKNISGVYGNFAYILKVSNTMKLSFGARAGYAMYKFNFSEVKYKDADENAYTDLNNTRKGALDIDAGMFLKSNSFFAGVSMTHLNRGRVYKASFQDVNSVGTTVDYSLSYNLNTHLFLTVGKSFAVNENFLITPSIMVKTVKGKTSADVNLNFFLSKRIWLGAYVRQGYGFGALFQVYATNQLRIGYSFDTGAGKQRVLGASHELMIGFDLRQSKSKMISPRFL